MRILVISDSHKRGDIIEKILYAQKEATQVFFLGDLASDIEDFVYMTGPAVKICEGTLEV